MRYVKALDQWLGVKPKVPSAWDKLEDLLSSGVDLIRKKKNSSSTTNKVAAPAADKSPAKSLAKDTKTVGGSAKTSTTKKKAEM